MSDTNQTFGAVLDGLMRSVGTTQAALARECSVDGVKVRQNTISEWCSDTNAPQDWDALEAVIRSLARLDATKKHEKKPGTHYVRVVAPVHVTPEGNLLPGPASRVESMERPRFTDDGPGANRLRDAWVRRKIGPGASAYLTRQEAARAEQRRSNLKAARKNFDRQLTAALGGVGLSPDETAVIIALRGAAPDVRAADLAVALRRSSEDIADLVRALAAARPEVVAALAAVARVAG
jgi:hypothetical protein